MSSPSNTFSRNSNPLAPQSDAEMIAQAHTEDEEALRINGIYSICEKLGYRRFAGQFCVNGLSVAAVKTRLFEMMADGVRRYTPLAESVR
jgi:hypothetical protein